MTDHDTLTLESADPQDLVDILCGLTALGSYSANVGLDDQADRIDSLRSRLIVENREIAEALVLLDDVGATAVGDEELVEGVRSVLRGDD